ncbi:PQQ-dependent sugar dehydrogenase [Luteolibacter algae]|uniref:PQQ-dependent sugar dehydrogenase n=1 Tax=Luteolibacter algae TaxID=454151 RepID=A0ABW5DA94_9BACT
MKSRALPARAALFFLAMPLAQTAHAEIGTELLYRGLERPVWVGAPSKTTGKLWAMEQAGKIWIIDLQNGTKSDKPFLDISDRADRRMNEEGLLGLAFSPDFEETGRYYINYTTKDSTTRIVRYISKDRKTTDAGSGEVILEYKQPYDNHNGGWLDFGPDGMLYIATGDGGSGFDPQQYAQDLSSLLGKLLRLDVSGEKGYRVPEDNGFKDIKGAKPEIHAFGLRNPWRCSFDRKTNDLWIGDVGQKSWEEIDFVPHGELSKKNFGWRLREGDVETMNLKGKSVGGPEPENYHAPIYVYKQGSGPKEGYSVTGGYVYRGKDIKELQGRYIFGDYQNPRIWSFSPENGKVSDFKDHTESMQPKGGRINLISSFGEDAEGELYLTDLSGPIYRVVEK